MVGRPCEYRFFHKTMFDVCSGQLSCGFLFDDDSFLVYKTNSTRDMAINIIPAIKLYVTTESLGS